MPRLNRFGYLPLMAAVMTCSGAIAAESPAKTKAPLSAADSDPNKLGWMQGFPVPKDKLIMQPESDFFSFPKLRWTVCHIRELMPTTEVSRGIGAPTTFDYALDKNIDAVTFTPTGSKKPMTWLSFGNQ